MSMTEQSPSAEQPAARKRTSRNVIVGFVTGAVTATGVSVGAELLDSAHKSDVIAGANRLVEISERDGFTVNPSAGSDPRKYGIEPYAVGQDQMGDDAVLSKTIVVHFDEKNPTKSPDNAWLPLDLGKCSLGSVRVTFTGTKTNPSDITDYRILDGKTELHAKNAQQLVADNPKYSKC